MKLLKKKKILNIVNIKMLYITINKIFTISMYIFLFLYYINIFICNSKNKK